MREETPSRVCWEVDTQLPAWVRSPDQAGFSGPPSPNLGRQQGQPVSWFLQEMVARGWWSDLPCVARGSAPRFTSALGRDTSCVSDHPGVLLS